MWKGADAFAIPHPLLLGDELPIWRGRNLTQVVEQVRREVWTRPASMDRTFGVVDTFGYLDAWYESGAAFERRVHKLGGRIKGAGRGSPCTRPSRSASRSSWTGAGR